MSKKKQETIYPQLLIMFRDPSVPAPLSCAGEAVEGHHFRCRREAEAR